MTTTFTALTAIMKPGRNSHTATLFPDGQVLLTGGFNSGADVSNTDYLNTAEMYNPATNTSTARTDHTATLLPNGQVLITGGTNYFANTAQYAYYNSYVHRPFWNENHEVTGRIPLPPHCHTL